MTISLDEAKQLPIGAILIDGNSKRWRVTGKVKLWKRDPTKIYVPIKHGLYTPSNITDHDFDNFSECRNYTKEQQ